MAEDWDEDRLTVMVYDQNDAVVHLVTLQAQYVDEGLWKVKFRFECMSEAGFTVTKARIIGWVRAPSAAYRTNHAKTLCLPLRKGESMQFNWTLNGKTLID